MIKKNLRSFAQDMSNFLSVSSRLLKGWLWKNFISSALRMVINLATGRDGRETPIREFAACGKRTGGVWEKRENGSCKMKFKISFTTKKDYPFKKIEEGLIVLNSDAGYARFFCPCGCRSPVNLPLHKLERPGKWGFSFNQNFGLTLTSLIKNSSCGHHFFITNSRVVRAY